jgi:hypothetical protein
MTTKTDEEIINTASNLHVEYGRVATLFPWQKELFIRLWRMAFQEGYDAGRKAEQIDRAED